MAFRSSLKIGLDLIPGVENPNSAFSFAVEPTIVAKREGRERTQEPDLMTQSTFASFGVQVDGDQLQYNTQLVIECHGEHLIEPDMLEGYVGLEESLHPRNFSAIRDGEVAFYDASTPSDTPNRKRGFTARIWMDELIARCLERRPEVKRLGGGDAKTMMVAGIVSCDVKDEEHANRYGAEKRGFIIIAQQKNCAVYFNMQDIVAVITAFLRLHALPDFHAFMSAIGASVPKPRARQAARADGETTATVEEGTASANAKPSRRHGKPAKKAPPPKRAKSKAEAKVAQADVDDDKPSRARSGKKGKASAAQLPSAPSPKTRLGDKLAAAGVTTVAEA